jgi:hypothetical protein
MKHYIDEGRINRSRKMWLSKFDPPDLGTQARKYTHVALVDYGLQHQTYISARIMQKKVVTVQKPKLLPRS